MILVDSKAGVGLSVVLLVSQYLSCSSSCSSSCSKRVY